MLQTKICFLRIASVFDLVKDFELHEVCPNSIGFLLRPGFHLCFQLLNLWCSALTNCPRFNNLIQVLCFVKLFMANINFYSAR